MDNVSALSLHPVLVLGRGEEGKPILPVRMGDMGTPWGTLEEACGEETVDMGMGPWSSSSWCATLSTLSLSFYY